MWGALKEHAARKMRNTLRDGEHKVNWPSPRRMRSSACSPPALADLQLWCLSLLRYCYLSLLGRATRPQTSNLTSVRSQSWPPEGPQNIEKLLFFYVVESGARQAKNPPTSIPKNVLLIILLTILKIILLLPQYSSRSRPQHFPRPPIPQ